MRFRSPLAVAALLCASLAPAAAQETPPQETFGELIEVRVVNVEVVVTDRDGNRVSGLGPADFRLTVDGNTLKNEERIDMKRRIRDVIQARDGALLVITDEKDGALLRLTPEGGKTR